MGKNIAIAILSCAVVVLLIFVAILVSTLATKEVIDNTPSQQWTNIQTK